MNAEQTTTYLQALTASLTISVIIPLVILMLLLLGAWMLLVKAQAKAGFNIE